MGKLQQMCGIWSRVLIDLLAIALLGGLELGVYLAEKNGVVAEKRGFFCDDTSIRLPFKHSTVPGWALSLSAACTPLVAVSSLSLVLAPLYIRTINVLSCFSCVHNADYHWELPGTFCHKVQLH